MDPEVNFAKIPSLTIATLRRLRSSSGRGTQREPSDELKELRKSIGVLVKGTLSLCPPPVLTGCTRHARVIPESLQVLVTFNAFGSTETMLASCSRREQCTGITPHGLGQNICLYYLPMIPHLPPNRGRGQ